MCPSVYAMVTAYAYMMATAYASVYAMATVYANVYAGADADEGTSSTVTESRAVVSNAPV